MSIYLVWTATDYPGGKTRTEVLCALWSADDSADSYAKARAYSDAQARSLSAGETRKRVVVAETKAAAIEASGHAMMGGAS